MTDLVQLIRCLSTQFRGSPIFLQILIVTTSLLLATLTVDCWFAPFAIAGYRLQVSPLALRMTCPLQTHPMKCFHEFPLIAVAEVAIRRLRLPPDLPRVVDSAHPQRMEVSFSADAPQGLLISKS